MTTSQEAKLKEQVRSSPHDARCQLVYADWLEEQGRADEAADLRHRCRYRMPLQRSELKQIKAVADQPPVFVEPTAPPGHFSQPACNRLQQDLARLDVSRIARHFPRDSRGQLALKTLVVLAHYEPHDRKDFFLAVQSPQRRKDEQKLTVSLLDGRILNHEYDWSQREERWRTGVEGDVWTRQWSSELMELAEFENDAKRSALVNKSNTSRTKAESIATAIHWLDEGRFEEALSLFGVTCCNEVSRTLYGESFALRCACDCKFEQEKLADRRAEMLRLALWASAPWQFDKAIQIHRDRLNAASSKRSRSEPELYLYIVAGQIHARRARLTLTTGEEGEPHLTFLASASNTRPWRWTWTRPIEFDVQRLRPSA